MDSSELTLYILIALICFVGCILILILETLFKRNRLFSIIYDICYCITVGYIITSFIIIPGYVFMIFLLLMGVCNSILNKVYEDL